MHQAHERHVGVEGRQGAAGRDDRIEAGCRRHQAGERRLARKHDAPGQRAEQRCIADELNGVAEALLGPQQQGLVLAKRRAVPQGRTEVRQARALIRDPLKRWELEDLIPATELLVSELVTNAFKYAKGETSMRLILQPDSLVCEVHDTSPALPRVLQVDKDAESGRGLHVVSQLAARWGARRTHTGKVVWCSQPVPEEIGDAMRIAMGIELEPVPHH